MGAGVFVESATGIVLPEQRSGTKWFDKIEKGGAEPSSEDHSMASNIGELLAKYVRACWVLKIRLMSARRHLWASQTSLIHIENALLQMRKACETIGYLCLIAAEVDVSRVPSRADRINALGKVLKRLPANGRRHLPAQARLLPREERKMGTVWELHIGQSETDDVNRIKRIHARSGQLLHDEVLYREFEKLSKGALLGDLNTVRGDHQWLWNRFWQRCVELRGTHFFVKLGNECGVSPPFAIKQQVLDAEDIKIAFDPNIICDFDVPVDWGRLSGEDAR